MTVLAVFPLCINEFKKNQLESIQRETETETCLFNTTWHYTDAWYQTYMTFLCIIQY